MNTTKRLQRLEHLEAMVPRSSCPTCRRWPGIVSESLRPDGTVFQREVPERCPDCGAAHTPFMVIQMKQPDGGVPWDIGPHWWERTMQ